MRVVYLDLETTGLEPRDQILEVGMLVDNLQAPEVPLEDCPTFECLVSHPRIEGNVKALAMNFAILAALADPMTSSVIVIPQSHLMARMTDWLRSIFGKDCNQLTIGGKNPAFDLRMLEESGVAQMINGSLWLGAFRIHHRRVDPTFCYFDVLRDLELPNTNTCLERAYVQKQTVHRALDDCRNIAMLVRAEMKRREASGNRV